MDAGWSEIRSHDGAPNELAPHELSQEVDSWLCVPTSTDKVATAVPVASPADTEQLAAPKDGVRQAGSTSGVRSSGGVALDECAPTEEEGTSHQVAPPSQPQPPGPQGLEVAASTAITLAARPAVPALSERHHVAASGAAGMGVPAPPPPCSLALPTAAERQAGGSFWAHEFALDEADEDDAAMELEAAEETSSQAEMAAAAAVTASSAAEAAAAAAQSAASMAASAAARQETARAAAAAAAFHSQLARLSYVHRVLRLPASTARATVEAALVRCDLAPSESLEGDIGRLYEACKVRHGAAPCPQLETRPQPLVASADGADLAEPAPAPEAVVAAAAAPAAAPRVAAPPARCAGAAPSYPPPAASSLASTPPPPPPSAAPASSAAEPTTVAPAALATATEAGGEQAAAEGRHHECMYCGRRDFKAAAARGKHQKTCSARPVALAAARRSKEARLAAPPAADVRAEAAAAAVVGPCSSARGPTAVHDAPSEQPASRKARRTTVRAPTGASGTHATEPIAASAAVRSASRAVEPAPAPVEASGAAAEELGAEVGLAAASAPGTAFAMSAAYVCMPAGAHSAPATPGTAATEEPTDVPTLPLFESDDTVAAHAGAGTSPACQSTARPARAHKPAATFEAGHGEKSARVRKPTAPYEAGPAPPPQLARALAESAATARATAATAAPAAPTAPAAPAAPAAPTTDDEARSRRKPTEPIRRGSCSEVTRQLSRADEPEPEEGEAERPRKRGRPALCFCGTPRHLASNDTSFSGVWIQCDDCSRWCHGECAGFDKRSAEAVETYSCPGCTAKPRQAPLSARQRPTHGCEPVPPAQAGQASKAQGGRKRAKATAAARDAASNAAAAAPGTTAHAPVTSVSAPADTPVVPTADARARDLLSRVRKPLRPYEAGPAPPPKFARELAERVAAERSEAEPAAGPLAAAPRSAPAAASGRATPGRKRQRGPADAEAVDASGAAAEASPEPLGPQPLLPPPPPPPPEEEAQLKPRPRGRAPVGKAWDHFCGVWVPLSELRPYPQHPHTQAAVNAVLDQASSGNLGFIELAENDPPGTLAAATAAAEALGLQVRQRPAPTSDMGI